MLLKLLLILPTEISIGNIKGFVAIKFLNGENFHKFPK